MSSYVTRKTPGDTAWFTHDRFGMFIHFGLYAMPAPPRMGEDQRKKSPRRTMTSTLNTLIPTCTTRAIGRAAQRRRA